MAKTISLNIYTTDFTKEDTETVSGDGLDKTNPENRYYVYWEDKLGSFTPCGIWVEYKYACVLATVNSYSLNNDMFDRENLRRLWIEKIDQSCSPVKILHSEILNKEDLKKYAKEWLVEKKYDSVVYSSRVEYFDDIV